MVCKFVLLFSIHIFHNNNLICFIIDFVIANRERGLGYMGDVMARSSFNALDYNHNGRLDYNEAVRPAYYGPRYY
jgi:hypothetical protein